MIGDEETSGEWKEGTEGYQEMSMDNLWSKLGLGNKVIPCFNPYIDPTALFTPWTREGEAFFADPNSRKVALAPQWHQLVGIHKMISLGFEGKPVLLMDEVGLGKTLQMIGTIAILAWFTEYHDQHKDYPGDFSESEKFVFNLYLWFFRGPQVDQFGRWKNP